MLTPAQIKSHRFEQAGRNSYKMAEVDAFFDEVVASYEQMFKENGELIRKIGQLADKVEEYRNDEDNIRVALLTAQRMAEKIVREAKESVNGQLEEAQEKAKKILDEAQAKADAIKTESDQSAEKTLQQAQEKADTLLNDAQKSANDILFNAEEEGKKKLGEINRTVLKESLVRERIKKEVSNFRSELISMYKAHVELIDKIPAIVENEQDAQYAVEAPTPEVPAETTQETELKQQQPVNEAVEVIKPVAEVQDFEEIGDNEESNELEPATVEQSEDPEAPEVVNGFQVNLEEIVAEAKKEEEIEKSPAAEFIDEEPDSENETKEESGFTSFFRKK